MNIFIRTDSSVVIGSGHVMRCLTLADLLAERGHRVSFLCRKLEGNLNPLLEGKGYTVFGLTAGSIRFAWGEDAQESAAILARERADWLVVDHYGIDEKWESTQRDFTGKIMVIDDLADRKHDCDLLLDQNLYPNMDLRYEGLVPSGCRKLFGPRFVLLRKEFDDARSRLKKRSGQVKKILVFFGGADSGNVTGRALKALQSFDYGNIEIDVIVGGMNPYREQIEAECSAMRNVRFHCQVNNMAALMAEADLAVGAGGTSTWERCYLGLPCVTIIIADNQAEVTRSVAACGAAWNLGWHQDVESADIAHAIRFAIANPDAVLHMTERAFELMGDNAAGRQALVAELEVNFDERQV